MALFRQYDLLVATPNFWVGGAESVAVSLCNEAVKNGMGRVAALTFYGQGKLTSKLDSRVELIDLTKRNLFVSFLYMLWFLIWVKGPVISCQRFSNVFVGTASLFSFKSRKLIFREASVLIPLEGRKGFVKRCLMKLVYSLATHIVANSEDTKNDLLKWDISNSSNISVIGNPVIPENVGELKKELVGHKWFSGSYRVILNVGRLHPVKGLTTLLHSAAPVLLADKNAKLVLIGDGPQRQELEALAISLGVSESFDVISYKLNVYSYMSKADVFVSTSIMEGFGNTIIEAHAAGLIVICVECPGGSNHLAENAEGSFVIERDYEALSAAISNVLAEGRRSVSCEWQNYTQGKIFGLYKGLL